MHSLYNSQSPAETEAIGAELAGVVEPSAIVAFYGGLGAGKTAFIRGFCRAFGINRISSPTFAIVNEYSAEKAKIYHFDMYRITSEADLESVGFFDYTDGILLIEWFENIEKFVTPSYRVNIKITGETSREIDIEKI
jgi:tRNA threonylcarbamoyladenosine biosynthesis protein TsaE